MRYIYPLALIAALALVGGVAYFQYGSSTYTSPVSIPSVPAAQTHSATTTPTTSVPGYYTLADVAQHASASDCWTAINGSVYNLTPFIPVHPGGDRITAVCGIDGTSLFEGQHGGNRQANADLAQLKIGTLAQ